MKLSQVPTAKQLSHPLKMVTLQHRSVDALIQSGLKYDGNNVVIENVIFEVDQLKDILKIEIDDLNEEYKILQKIKNKKVLKLSEKFEKIVSEISKELFDDFTYVDSINTFEEVEWKEYFHCLYDHMIPDETSPFNPRTWETLPVPPKELDSKSKCWSIVNSLKRKFDALKNEGHRLESPSEIFESQKQLGKELLTLKKEIATKNEVLETYYRIIEWSMH